jgi:stage III sporulation protein AG
MSSEKSKILNKVTDFVKKNKLISYLIAIFIAILLSIILFSGINSTKNTNEQLDNIEYVETLETRLSDALSSVLGAGKVKVVITVESGMETVLATKVSINQNNGVVERKEEPITVNGKTVVIKENYPKITGVLIVAQGADNISVKTKILNATVSLLDINVNDIEILTMK